MKLQLFITERIEMKNNFIVAFTILFFSLVSVTSFAQEGKDSLKILFVGNSYTHFENMPQIVSIISDNSKSKLLTRKSTVGGARLREHWLGERGLKTKEMIKNGNFDIVVLQEYSMGAIDQPDSLLKYSSLFCDFIKENKAKPYFYLTWAREKVPQHQETINKIYLKAATENEANIVPVGKAWALAKQYRPDIELFNPDGSHPSDLGAFLTACIFVATILDEIPDKINGIFTTNDLYGESIKLMAIHPLDVAFCVKIAEEIVLK